MHGSAAIVLATQTSASLGGPVALAPWGAGNVVEHLAATAHSAGFALVVVTLGPSADAILAGSDLGGAAVVEDPEWEEGTAASLRVSLDVVSRDLDVELAVIIDIDRPGIAKSLLIDLVNAHRASTAPVMVPKYRYAWGTPIVVARRLWPTLMGREGDIYLLQLLQAYPSWVSEHRVDELAPTRIVTQADLLDAAPRSSA